MVLLVTTSSCTPHFVQSRTCHRKSHDSHTSRFHILLGIQLRMPPTRPKGWTPLWLWFGTWQWEWQKPMSQCKIYLFYFSTEDIHSTSYVLLSVTGWYAWSSCKICSRKYVVLEDARNVVMHELVVTNSITKCNVPIWEDESTQRQFTYHLVHQPMHDHTTQLSYFQSCTS